MTNIKVTFWKHVPMLYKLKRIQILKHTIYSVKTLTFLAKNLILAMYIQKKMTNVMTSNQRLSSLCSLIFLSVQSITNITHYACSRGRPSPCRSNEIKISHTSWFPTAHSKYLNSQRNETWLTLDSHPLLLMADYPEDNVAREFWLQHYLCYDNLSLGLRPLWVLGEHKPSLLATEKWRVA